MDTISWRDEIDASFGDGPAPGDSAGAILAAGRRRLLRRRLAGTLGAGAAVAVLAVGAPLVAQQSGGPGVSDEQAAGQVPVASQSVAPTGSLAELEMGGDASEQQLVVVTSDGDEAKLSVDRQTGELTLPDELRIVDRGTLPGSEDRIYEVGLDGGSSLYVAIQQDTILCKRDAAGRLQQVGEEVVERDRQKKETQKAGDR